MKTRAITIITLMLMLYGCLSIPDGYTKYQTFDEYTLSGIKQNGTLKSPFVAIKRTSDSISVLVYDQSKVVERHLYQKKNSYWFSIKREQIDPKIAETCKCDTTPRYIEKFIYNDTILEYTYSVNGEDNKSLDLLSVYTKNNNIYISPEKFNISENRKFDQFKDVVKNYNVKYPYFKPGTIQKSFYETKYKFFKGDTLFIYEKNGNPNYKIGCLRSAAILNSLGEYGGIGKNILYNIKESERCK